MKHIIFYLTVKCKIGLPSQIKHSVYSELQIYSQVDEGKKMCAGLPQSEEEAVEMEQRHVHEVRG